MIYLGSTITDDGGSERETRKTVSKKCNDKIKKVWEAREITTTNIKQDLVYSLVFLRFLYGMESWTLKENEKKMIDTFEIWQKVIPRSECHE